MKLVVGICGSSGVELGLKFASQMTKVGSLELHLIISNGAKEALKLESNLDIDMFFRNGICNGREYLYFLNNERVLYYNDYNLGAKIASGSFYFDNMVILPCSSNTLAKIANGISDTLITRSASVCLKQGRKLLISPREMPFSGIMINNMLTLSRYNAVIMPPILGYYSGVDTLEAMENFIFGKILDSLNIANNLYKRWGE